MKYFCTEHVPIDEILALSVIETRIWLTLVDVDVARCPGDPWDTITAKGGDEVVTRSVIQARVRFAFVDVDLTATS